MEYTFVPNTLIEITSLAKEINPEIYDRYYKVYIRFNRFDFVIIVILKDMNRHLNIEKGKYLIQKESFDYEPYLQLDSIYLFQSLQKFVERKLKIRKHKFRGLWETNSFGGVEELLTGEIDGNIIIKETENAKL